jgi:hypothetical protein
MAEWCESFLKAQSEFAQPIYPPAEANALAAMIASAARFCPALPYPAYLTRDAYATAS